MSDGRSQFLSIVNTQRFRRVGTYGFDQLLRDLRELDVEIQTLRHGVGGGDAQGEQGPPGVAGKQGDTGAPGTPGKPGVGTQGDPGLSAYEMAVLIDGFEGTEEEWLDSLKADSEATIVSDPDDWGFIDADYGLVTQPVAGLKVDYGMIPDGETSTVP